MVDASASPNPHARRARRRHPPPGPARRGEVAIVGTGVEARGTCTPWRRPALTGIRITGRDPARAREVAAELTGRLNVPVTASGSVPRRSTGPASWSPRPTRSNPVLRREWLAARSARQRGSARACPATGSSTPRPWLRRPCRRQPSPSATSPGLPAGAAEGADNPVRAELGELLTGTATGRSGDEEITVFESLGLAARTWPRPPTCTRRPPAWRRHQRRFLAARCRAGRYRGGSGAGITATGLVLEIWDGAESGRGDQDHSVFPGATPDPRKCQTPRLPSPSDPCTRFPELGEKRRSG